MAPGSRSRSTVARKRAFSSITSSLASTNWAQSFTCPKASNHEPEARNDHFDMAVRWWLYVVFIQPNATPHRPKKRSQRWVRARRARRFRTALGSVAHQEGETVDVLQRDGGAFRHSVKRVVRHVHGEFGLVLDSLVQPAQLGSSSGKVNPCFEDVS